MMNAGIVQRDTDKRRVSAQVYTTESTKFIKKQLAEVESNFHQIQARLTTGKAAERARQSAQQVVNKKRPKYGEGDEDDEEEYENTAVSEGEMKSSDEVNSKKDDYRKMVRDRKR